MTEKRGKKKTKFMRSFGFLSKPNVVGGILFREKKIKKLNGYRKQANNARFFFSTVGQQLFREV